MVEKIKEPEDLGVKIGTQEEVAWTQIRDSSKREVEQSKRTIIIGEAIIELADSKIKEEQDAL